MHIKGIAILNNGVTSIVPALRSAAQLHAVAEDIHNLALALVTPLRSKYDSRHLRELLDQRVALFVHQESPLKGLKEFTHTCQTFNARLAPPSADAVNGSMPLAKPHRIRCASRK